MSERPPSRPGQSLAFDFSAKEPEPEAAPAPPPPKKDEPRIFTVAQLGRALGRTLERIFVEAIFVEGEVSGVRAASSGHVYFSLKDETEEASIDVVLYRSALTPRARTLIADGARLRVRGKPVFWPPRGRLQFQGDRVEPTGKGALLEALERLKAKLAAEGLFAEERKRPLPHEPRVVGVVTSRSGAVIHDIQTVAFRRGGARILLAPAQVQGAGAVDAVRRALRMLQRVEAVDVIIVARGGGSQDDLLAFNDEDLVRDVAACRVPVVSAVGHEVDVTLVDFAADARAATPSQAAEMVVPDAGARTRLLEEHAQGLRRAMQSRLAHDRVGYERLARAFRDPRLLIANAQQLVDDRASRLQHAMIRRIAVERDALARVGPRLAAAHPRERIAREGGELRELRARLGRAIRERLGRDDADARAASVRLSSVMRERATRDGARLAAACAQLLQNATIVTTPRAQTLAGLAARLDAMSPLAVLGRGYAIASKDGRAIRDARAVSPGDRVHVRVAEGAFDAEVVNGAPRSKKRP
jgi:exodeoxyribonuclease VII large subunit